MRAVDADPAGKMKQMLQDTVPVTAFVPVDSVSDEHWVGIPGMDLPAVSYSAAGWPPPMPANGASQAISASKVSTCA